MTYGHNNHRSDDTGHCDYWCQQDQIGRYGRPTEPTTTEPITWEIFDSRTGDPLATTPSEAMAKLIAERLGGPYDYAPVGVGGPTTPVLTIHSGHNCAGEDDSYTCNLCDTTFLTLHGYVIHPCEPVR